MNCANHVAVPAAAYCRTCGKPLCSACARDVRGVIFCEECLASHVSEHMPPPGAVAGTPGAPPRGSHSPGLAAMLGFIPGVGAFYNGEYAKGFIHVAIFATLIVLSDKFWVFGLLIGAFELYMPFEAYQTAKAREMGLPPPDPFGINQMFGSPHVGPVPPVQPAAAAGVPTAGTVSAEGNPVVVESADPDDYAGRSKAPVGALILVGLGVLFLLNTMNLLNFDWGRFWPLILIAVGLWTLAKRNRVRS